MTRLLINPEAGGVADRGFRRRLSDLEVEFDPTSDPAEMTAKTRRAAAQGLDRVLVAGGDGTLHHAIHGLVGTSCALGIVPGGRGNGLARALGVPLEPKAALSRAMTAVPRRIDLGSVAGRIFAGVAGIGFDGEMLRVAQRLRRFGGRSIYLYSVLRALLFFRPPEVRVEFEGGGFEGSAMLVAIANASHFGEGMMIAPQARLDDGLLDLVVVERIAPLRFLTLFPRIHRGTHVGHPAVRSFRVRRAEIRVDRPLVFHGDGEPLTESGSEASRIEVRPRGLWVAA